MNEKSQIMAGVALGALVGGVAAFVFLTESGRAWRDRVEPAIDNLRVEFDRFRGTLEKLGEMASEGVRALNEFQAARGNSPYAQSQTH